MSTQENQPWLVTCSINVVLSIRELLKSGILMGIIEMMHGFMAVNLRGLGFLTNLKPKEKEVSQSISVCGNSSLIHLLLL